MADGSSGNIRSIYVEWALRDKVSGPAEQIDRRLSLTRNRAEEVKYSFWDTNSAMESLSSAGAFFGNIEQDLRETAIRQQYHNQLLGEAAVKYTRLKTSAREFAETTKTKMQQATAAINEHQGAILGIGAALTGAGYVGYNYYAAGVKDLGNYEDAYATFVRNVGADSERLIAQMKEASAGTVSETQIILNANRAMVMDIPYDYLPRMMEVSRASARAMGQDINYMFESIVTGSARESPLILDNLGIQMNQLADYEKEWAKARGINVNALTAEQQRQIFLNYVMENSAAILQKVDLSQESLNEQTARSRVVWEEFRRELTAGARPVIAGILDITEGATAALRDMPAPLKAVIGTAGLVGTAIAGIGGPLLINAVAVAYLVTNYQFLIGALATARANAALHASTLLTRLIPASVATAYAQGGLTAALWAGAAASWAFLAPWLPIIGAVGLAVGAVLLLQDVLTKGWADSYLGQFVSWLLEKLPFLQPVVDTVAGGFQWFRDAVVSAASGVRAFLDKLGPLKYLILGPVMPLLLLKDLLTGTGDSAGTFIRDLAAIPGALRAFIADPIGTVTGVVRGFFDWLTSLPQKAASVLQGATQLPIIGPVISMLQDGAAAVSAFLDRFGPLKYALLGPVGALIYLAKNFDTVTATIRGFIDWIAAIPRTLGSAAAAITDNPVFKMLSGAASFAANPFGTALEFITPKVKPEVIAPDMDPEYYTKGSIAFKVRTPEVRPDILPPEPSVLDRISSLLAGALAAPILPAFAAPAVQMLAPEMPALRAPRIPDLVAPRIPDIAAPEIPAITPPEVQAIAAPRIPDLVAPRIPAIAAPEIPAITPPEIPAIEAPGTPGQAPRTAAPITITIQNTIEVNGTGNSDIQKQIRDALSRSTADQVKLVERRLVDHLRAFGI